MKFEQIVPLFKETFQNWREDHAPRMAAALSFYTLFAIAPLLIIAVAVAGFFFAERAVEGELAIQIEKTVGHGMAQAIKRLVADASKPTSGIMATIVAIGTLLLGAVNVFGQLQDALNTVWGVAPRPGRGLLRMLKDRFFPFTMVLGTGFLLLISFVLSATLAALTKFMAREVPGLSPWVPLMDLVVSALILTVLFAMIFKLLPEARIEWRDVWTGAAMTALLFAVGKYLIGVYLGRSSASAYGAAGSLVVLLLWVYYAAQILLFGAEFTKVYAFKHGSRSVGQSSWPPA
jgi:membrane protein